eukprot:PhF_6_TR40423/c0_g1_i3/m.60262
MELFLGGHKLFLDTAHFIPRMNTVAMEIVLRSLSEAINASSPITTDNKYFRDDITLGGVDEDSLMIVSGEEVVPLDGDGVWARADSESWEWCYVVSSPRA